MKCVINFFVKNGPKIFLAFIISFLTAIIFKKDEEIDGLQSTFQDIVNILTKRVQLPIISLPFLILLPSFLHWMIKKIFFKKDNSSVILDFTNDIIEGVKYKWEWTKLDNGKYQIKNLSSFCPSCDFYLNNGKCTSCKKSFVRKLKPDLEIDQIIKQKLNNKKPKLEN
ncbi:MAG: hypothetical protein H6581_20575 [Bacteroidia bacterium]|nr:hypothetical protein [Bacteroidia bacterium]